MNTGSVIANKLYWQGGMAARSLLLFANFFLILLAYYLVKPASRSLLLDHVAADNLPYLWTASGVVLLALVPGYQRLLQRFGRVRVVLGTCMLTAALLMTFRSLFDHAGAMTAASFYILVDIFSVVLVEQFWSLTNSVYNSNQGRRWYGLIGSGGLVGGVVGGLLAGWLVKHTALRTEDLIAVAAMMVLCISLMTWRLARAGVYRLASQDEAPRAKSLDAGEVWHSIRSNRLVAGIALLLLFSQICEPIVEYQFMQHVETSYADKEARTVYLSHFLSLLSAVALGINLVVTPLIHRYLGVIAGLFVQPVLLAAAAISHAAQLDLRSAAVMKVADRGLSYSINRASRELLYVGAAATTIFRVKAWIDMVGYRAFKIVGNVGIVAVTQALPPQLSPYALTGAVLLLSIAWAMNVAGVGKLISRPRRRSFAVGRDGVVVLA